MKPWVVVSPNGVNYLGLHEDEAAAWSTALGWPSDDEIAEHKRAGWYAAEATVTWKRPGLQNELIASERATMNGALRRSVKFID